MAEYEHILVKRDGDTVTVTMNRAARRNSLSADHLAELLAAFREAGASDATGIVLAGAGPVFSAGHDFADVAARDLMGVRELLTLCTELMRTIQSVPQVVVARVHGLATAAGCQLVASCDLAVAAESAGFALPGGKAGWFCHTPAVPVARSIGRKRLMEMALTGDPVDARTAADWGLVNAAVPDDDLDAAVDALLARATRGSRFGKGVGKQTLLAQFELLDLAGRGARDRVAELHALGDLEAGELPAAVGDDLLPGDLLVGRRDDQRGHHLAPLLVRHPDHRDLGHRGVAEHRVLDLDRRDVLAAGDDHVLLAVADRQVAALVD